MLTDFIRDAFFLLLFNSQLGPFDCNSRAGGYRLRQPDAGADNAVFAYNRLSAQDCRVGVDNDVVFDGWMSFNAADEVAFFVRWEAQRAERNALIQLDPVPDVARLPDNDAGAVVDKERLANRRAGVNVDSRFAVRPFRHHTRNQRDAQDVKLVSDSINCNRLDSRIAEHRLVVGLARRIALVRRLNVQHKFAPNLRKPTQKL